MAVKIIGVLLALSIVVPFGIYFLSRQKSAKRGKVCLFTNIGTFFGTLLVGVCVLFSTGASAAAEAGVPTGGDLGAGLAYLAAALATGMSCVGAGIAVAAASSTALGAISENPKLMGKSLIFVALAEGIALYGLLVSFSILAKVVVG